MKKNILVASVFVLVASFGLVSSPSSAQAVCSPTGHWNSNGRCDDSMKWEKKEEKKDKKYENWNWSGNQYQYKQNFDLSYLQAYINHLMALLAAYQGGVNSNVSDVDVRTVSAEDITEDSATLRAVVEFNDEDEAELYFEYGTTYGNLNTKTDRVSITDDEDGDTLEEEVDDLEDDTKYFFRAVGVDEDGEKDYGTILSFITDNDDSDDDDDTDDEQPVVTTSAERNVDSDSADLRGTIDMNDFENGVSFFVYGEDEDQVDDVEDDFNTHDDVDVDDDDLRKSLVDSDVDDIETYTTNVAGLDSSTDIFFALCVAYEDEDDDEVLECGSTRSFETE